MNIVSILSEELNISQNQVNNVINLLNEGDTIPFIARYRKEQTGGLDDTLLRNFEERLKYLTNLNERKETILKSLESQGVLNDELKKEIDEVLILSELEDIYRPYKPKKRTRATIAKEKGLEPLASYIYSQQEIVPLHEKAQEFISEEKGVLTTDEAINGALDIIAEKISDEPRYRKYIKNLDYKKGLITSKEVKKEERDVYKMYQDYQERIISIPPHRILALSRGEKDKYLKVSLLTPDEEIISYLERKIIKNNSPFTTYLQSCIKDAYDRLIAPSIENEIRNDLFLKAEDQSMEIFKDNLKQLLMMAPLKGKTVLGFDPGYSHGCKLAVCNSLGEVLATSIIRPTLKSENEIIKSKKILLDLINKYHIDVIALGNGTASRESQVFINEVLKENNLEEKVKYLIVSEAGASVYSATELAKKEFPTFDVNLRSAVSIARRLQDPLAELVKIPPESIGVGQYQHDMDQKRLKETLSNVVFDCVNLVGVDCNTASVSLLNYISGITPKIAENIVIYRNSNGGFKSREDLKKVKMLGPKAFEQSAGFLRINGTNPLDNTSVHPESYELTLKLLKMMNLFLDDLGKENLIDSLDRLNIQEAAKQLNIGEMTLEDIVEELKKPGRDIRDDFSQVKFESSILTIDDLNEGMVLEGTVTNIMDFGCFVDIGVHVDGLVHISEMSSKYVKSPHDIVKLQQVVKVKIISLDKERKRIGLSLKQVNN